MPPEPSSRRISYWSATRSPTVKTSTAWGSGSTRTTGARPGPAQRSVARERDRCEGMRPCAVGARPSIMSVRDIPQLRTMAPCCVRSKCGFFVYLVTIWFMARIGITLGDPSGIGPEIVAAALRDTTDEDVVVYGDRGV